MHRFRVRDEGTEAVVDILCSLSFSVLRFENASATRVTECDANKSDGAREMMVVRRKIAGAIENFQGFDGLDRSI